MRFKNCDIIFLSCFLEVNMGLLKDLLFGSTVSSASSKKKPAKPKKSDFEKSYNDYYQSVYDDAISGDEAAQEEMRDEFGEDWEGEY